MYGISWVSEANTCSKRRNVRISTLIEGDLMGLEDDVRRLQKKQLSEQQLEARWKASGVGKTDPVAFKPTGELAKIVREAMLLLEFKMYGFVGIGPDGVSRFIRAPIRGFICARTVSGKRSNVKFADIPVGRQGRESPSLRLAVLNDGRVVKHDYLGRFQGYHWEKVSVAEIRDAIVEYLAQQ